MSKKQEIPTIKQNEEYVVLLKENEELMRRLKSYENGQVGSIFFFLLSLSLLLKSIWKMIRGMLLEHLTTGSRH